MERNTQSDVQRTTRSTKNTTAAGKDVEHSMIGIKVFFNLLVYPFSYLQ